VTPDERPVSPTTKLVSILLALIPAARMAWIVFTFGENNLSNDYGLRIPLVMSMLDRTCSLGKYFREAWVAGGHSLIAVTPFYYLNARFFDWSVGFELGIGLALVAATVVLLAGASPSSARWLLLPALSLLLFSTSRVTVFTFGEPALQYGLSQCGIAIGAFALGRYCRKPVLLAWALAFGGLIASWSWGGGVMVWPVFAAGLALAYPRRAAAWAIFAGGALAGVAQYAWLLHRGMPGATTGTPSWAAKGRLFLDLLGRPFVNGVSAGAPDPWSQAAGAAGLLLLGTLLVVLRTTLHERPAALALLGWTLLVALQIAMFRDGPAPWYTSPMAFFWAGLLMLLAGAPAPLRLGGIVVILLLSMRVQFTWEDKDFYLSSRSPSSAACLREWRTAPAACATSLFQWAGGAPPGWLGEPLEQRRLSVFGSTRTYLLQGDAAMGRVKLGTPDAPAFLSANDRTPGDLYDFHRLDLVLAPSAAVTWRVELPPDLKSARFETRVCASNDDPMFARGARASVEGAASEMRVLVPAGGRESLSLDLRPYAGRTAALKLVAEEAKGRKPLIFEAPKIELRLAR
jgi:hypothetical protein